MAEIKVAKVKLMGARKFVTGESRYCQHCGQEAYALYEVVSEGKVKNKLQYCKKCFDNR